MREGGCHLRKGKKMRRSVHLGWIRFITALTMGGLAQAGGCFYEASLSNPPYITIPVLDLDPPASQGFTASEAFRAQGGDSSGPYQWSRESMNAGLYFWSPDTSIGEGLSGVSMDVDTVNVWNPFRFTVGVGNR
jgi:hypothetical protein